MHIYQKVKSKLKHSEKLLIKAVIYKENSYPKLEDWF